MTQRERPQRAWLLSVVLAVGASVVWYEAATVRAPAIARYPLSWLIVAMGLAGASQFYVHFEVRRHGVATGLTPLVTAIGLVYLSPVHMLYATLLASPGVIFYYWRRAPVKAVFNAANIVLATAVCELVYRAVLGSSSAVSLRGWLAVAAAVATFELVTTCTIVLVVGLVTGRFVTGSMVGAGVTALLNVPLSAILAVVATAVIWEHAAVGGLLVLVSGATAGFGYRAYQALRQRHQRLDTLYQYTRQLSDLSDRAHVLTATLQQAGELLNATTAELMVVDPTGTTRYFLDSEGRLNQDSAARTGALETMALTSGAVLAPRHVRTPEITAALAERGVVDAVAVSLPSGAHQEVLVVADRPASRDTFDEHDLEMLQTLAAHSGVAIRNTRLLEQLRDQVSAREHESLHDSLTGLPNRVLFARWTDEALRQRSDDSMVAIMIIDLDGFKEINDTLGHLTGDSILIEVASRLTAEVEGEAHAARLGGDEFAIVVPAAADEASVVALAGRIVDRIAEPVTSDGLALSTRASIGVALAPDHGITTSSLLKSADVAMYEAKARAGGISVYEPETDNHTTRRLILATELRQALLDETLEVHFQPKADMTTGRVMGFEALLRWTHPEYGLVAPDEFVPVAEQAGLIGPLTQWVLHRSLAQLRRWHDAGFDIDVAVNLSARNLLDAGLIPELEIGLVAAGVAPEHLTLELTESSIMGDPDRSERALAAITALGVRMAMDDFGTGYSSLSRLVRLPVSEIKIDKSFVLQLVDSKASQTIVRTTIDMATSLGYLVTAEGVEDRATWEVLAGLGAHCAQGFLLARPMSGPDSERWLREYRPFAGVSKRGRSVVARLPGQVVRSERAG